MMNSTWLSRKIKGPNAEGDPVKKKNGKGVKPYVTYDRDDPRIQAYSDSLDAHLLTNYFEKEFKANRGYNLYNTFRTKSANIVPANTPSLTTSKSWPYDYYASQTKMKPSRIISSNNKTEREFPLYDKPKQKVMLQSLEKMPIGKLKSKSTTPKKISNRKPSNFVSYDKPKKTSIANTGNPGSKTRYATVNKGDKRGTVYLTKSEYDKEMKNIFIKIK